MPQVRREHFEALTYESVEAHLAQILADLEPLIDHDQLLNYVAAEHIDWSVTGAEDIHADRISQGSVTQHQGALSLAASQIVSGTLTGRPVDLDGARLTIDADADSYLKAASDDVLELRAKGIVAVRIDGDAASPMNGITLQTSPSGSPAVIFPHGETNAGLTVIGAGTGDVVVGSITGGDLVLGAASIFLNGAPYKQVRLATATNQTISSTTQTNLTGLTGLTLPSTTDITGRKFRVSGVIQCSDNTGTTGRLVTLRCYNGVNGQMGETLIATFLTLVGPIGAVQIPFRFTFTPGASDRTKVGFSAQLSGAASTGFNNGILSSFDIEEVLE